MSLSPVVFSKASDEWSTPAAFVEECARLYGPYTCDVAARSDNTKCFNWYGPDHPHPLGRDGLAAQWKGHCWCNPPYSGIYQWLEKGVNSRALATTTFLLPSRTGTKWFHEFIAEDGRDFVVSPWVKILRFLRGRLKFGGSKNCAPFDSLLVEIGAE